MGELDALPLLARADLCLIVGDNRAYAGAPAQIAIGSVGFGGWQIYLVARTPPTFPASDAYLIKVNYDVGLTPDAPVLSWVEAGFEFADEGVAVVDALPRRVHRPVGASRYLLTEHLAFDVTGAGGQDGFLVGASLWEGILMPPLDPDIDAFGIGGPRIRWRHASVSGAAGPAGSQVGWLALVAPSGCRELNIRACARYSSTSRRIAGRRPGATSEGCTVRLPALGPLGSLTADAGGSSASPIPGQLRASSPSTPPLSVRMGFVVDVVGYSERVEPAQYALQQRLAVLITEVMPTAGIQLEPEYLQGTGDGMNVFLPAGADVSRALAALLTPTATLLHHDNECHADRIRLRIATDLGPVRPAATGFSGHTIVAFGRLVDSAPIRDAITRQPDADLAVLVSDWLYAAVVSQGYADLDPSQFTRVQAVVKRFQADAWLWTSAPEADTARSEAQPPRPGRWPAPPRR
jgi:class 3 adenylate cyclase